VSGRCAWDGRKAIEEETQAFVALSLAAIFFRLRYAARRLRFSTLL
jgi:hypothetical protein